MPLDLLLRDGRLPDGRVADIGCRAGRIVEIGALAGRAAAREIACEGQVVTPGLVDSHIHLDKALLGARAPSREGTVSEAIRVTGAAKRGFTREDIADRARRVLDLAVRQGTTAMRSHVEVDPIVGLMGFEAIGPLRREYAPAIDLQLCAFAQEGILQMPGTEALLREALRMGADLVGGVPYNDTDAHRHIAIVFDLAAEFGVDVDFHTDFFDEPQHLHALHIAEETIRRGWQGRVALGHMSEMAALPPDEQDRVARVLARAGVAVIALPATDLYLMGRKDVRAVRRGIAPVKRLLAAGVTVAAATNNVRNAFTPLGTAGLPLMGYLLGVAAHLGADPELRVVLDTLTTHPARILRLADYGLTVGARADLAIWEAERVEDVIAALAPCRLVVKAGRVSVEHARSVTEPWRSLTLAPGKTTVP
ncbi:MAG TPA: amidohydrolase family protein [Methylomirabilota bacterium]|nr:amidohydrolase family protein [Methylomirabilota bacterium]